MKHLFSKKWIAVVCSVALLVSLFAVALPVLTGIAADEQTFGTPVKSVVIDDFTNAVENYYKAADRASQSTFEVKDGSVYMSSAGSNTAQGFTYNATKLTPFTTTGYEYIEFDIWTDAANLFVNAQDARVNLGVGDVDRTHDNANLAGGKGSCPGELKANEVNTIRVPLETMTVRANNDAVKAANPDGKKANDFTFDRYNLTINYGGGKFLSDGSTTYNIRVDEVRLTTYTLPETWIVDDFTNAAENYTKDANRARDTSLEVKDGSLIMTSKGSTMNEGFTYSVVNLPSFTTTGYDYIEFDIWTDAANLYVNSQDARVNLGVGDVSRTHDNANLAGGKGDCPGELKAGEVNTIRVPLETMTVRANATVNPDNKKANDFTFDCYTLVINYGGGKFLGDSTNADTPVYTVRVDEVRLSKKAEEPEVSTPEESTPEESTPDTPAEPTEPKNVWVIDDFTDPTYTYELEGTHSVHTTAELKDGSYYMYATGEGSGHGFTFKSPNIEAFTTTGYEYIELVLWTDAENLYLNSKDSRINLGVGLAERTHDDAQLGAGKSRNPGKLTANEVNVIRIPLESFTVRNDPERNPDGKKANDFTFDRYSVMISYNGDYNLGSGKTYTVRMDEIRLVDMDGDAPERVHQSLVVDDFDRFNTQDYVLDTKHSNQTTLEVKDGSLYMQATGEGAGHGFVFKSPNLVPFTTTGYDYIEIDLWTDAEDLYANALDGRINLGVGAVDRTHDNANMGQGKSHNPGKMVANEVNTIRVPLSSFGTRGDANALSVNPDKKPATDFTFDRYAFVCYYGSGKDLGKGTTYTVRLDQIRLIDTNGDAPEIPLDQAKVDDIIAKIDALKDVKGADDKERVLAVNAAYEALSNKEKAAVTNYDILKTALTIINTPIKEVLLSDFSDLSEITFRQAGLVYNADGGYIEIQNTADAHDKGFDFTMPLNTVVDASGCQYLEFDVWTNEPGIFFGVDQRILLGSSSQLGGLVSHQCAQGSLKPYLTKVGANEWVHVRIPFTAFAQTSNNPNGLPLDLSCLSINDWFFRFNGNTALEGYDEQNPAILRLRNVVATQYETLPVDAPSKDPYTVTFVDADGKEIEKLSVHFACGVEAPAAPVVDGKTFIGWDTDYSFVTGDITVKPLYRDDTEAVLKAEAEAALAAIGTVTKDNAAEQAVLVNAARQAIATLTDKVDGAKADALAGYAKLTAAEKALADLTGYAVVIDGVKDDKYTESINLKDYTTLLGVDKLPDVAVDGKAYMTWDDDNVYVYIEYPEAIGRIEARIDTDPSLNTGDYRGLFATYSNEQSDELIIRHADGTIVFAGGKGDATMAAGLNTDGKKTLEFAWPLTGEEMFGLSVVASHAGDNAYYVSSYAGWCDYNSLHYYYLMTRAELIAKAEELIGAIGEVTEDNIYDVEEAISEARTLIDNALASYEDFSTDVIENYLDLRKAEHVYNYYFAGNTGTAPSLPPLEEIDVMLSTESEDLNINMLSKVITVNTKMTVAELIAALEADEGVELTIVNVDGRVVKGSTYVRDTYRLFATIADKGQATYALLYLGDEVTEPEELEPLPEVSEPEDEESTGGSTSDDSGAENPGTGVTTYVFVAVLMMLAAGTVLVLTRKQRVR